MSAVSAVLDVGVAGIGLLGPGLVDWASALPLLRDPALWQRVPTVVPAPALLPATVSSLSLIHISEPTRPY